MNLQRANEIRASLGLAPIVATKTDAAKRRKTERNRAERGAESRALKASRQGRSKK